MRFTKTTQDKLHRILISQGYIVRYEKGSFQAGYCIVQAQKTVIINKFFTIEGVVQALLEIVRQIEITDAEALPDELLKWVEKIKKQEDHSLEG
jgi:hypothetical protein